jgi:hypothetical protein
VLCFADLLSCLPQVHRSNRKPVIKDSYAGRLSRISKQVRFTYHLRIECGHELGEIKAAKNKSRHVLMNSAGSCIATC